MTITVSGEHYTDILRALKSSDLRADIVIQINEGAVDFSGTGEVESFHISIRTENVLEKYTNLEDLIRRIRQAISTERKKKRNKAKERKRKTKPS